MFREESIPTARERRTAHILYDDARRQLRSEFDKLSFKELTMDYILAERAINELLYAEGGNIILEVRCDDAAAKTLATVKDLRDYQTDVQDYFDSLRKQTGR